VGTALAAAGTLGGEISQALFFRAWSSGASGVHGRWVERCWPAMAHPVRAG
jgi:hypothetical protein